MSVFRYLNRHLTVSLFVTTPQARIAARAAHRTPDGAGRLLLLAGRRFRSLRQWRRAVGLGIQIGDDVGPLSAAREAREAHRGSGHEALRVLQERVQVPDRPFAG